jgi:L-cysteine:1D-myo-inositol 2-amino-2-deoxy-alpha-D-glucopyranoside ligase
MAAHFLGETIDIHSGGDDLLFPHHESEIAQVEPVTGQKPFVRFWFHTAMVRYRGEKMSKSLGNLVMARDLLQRYSADGLRLYMAQHHYREPWDYEETALARADELVQQLRAAVEHSGGEGAELDATAARIAFQEAMDTDLNTPAAVAILIDLANNIVRAAQDGQRVDRAQNALRRLGRILGLRLDAAEAEPAVRRGWDQHLQRFEPHQ